MAIYTREEAKLAASGMEHEKFDVAKAASIFHEAVIKIRRHDPLLDLERILKSLTWASSIREQYREPRARSFLSYATRLVATMVEVSPPLPALRGETEKKLSPAEIEKRDFIKKVEIKNANTPLNETTLIAGLLFPVVVPEDQSRLYGRKLLDEIEGEFEDGTGRGKTLRRIVHHTILSRDIIYRAPPPYDPAIHGDDQEGYKRRHIDHYNIMALWGTRSVEALFIRTVRKLMNMRHEGDDTLVSETYGPIADMAGWQLLKGKLFDERFNLTQRRRYETIEELTGAYLREFRLPGRPHGKTNEALFAEIKPKLEKKLNQLVLAHLGLQDENFHIQMRLKSADSISKKIARKAGGLSLEEGFDRFEDAIAARIIINEEKNPAYAQARRDHDAAVEKHERAIKNLEEASHTFHRKGKAARERPAARTKRLERVVTKRAEEVTKKRQALTEAHDNICKTAYDALLAAAKDAGVPQFVHIEGRADICLEENKPEGDYRGIHDSFTVLKQKMEIEIVTASMHDNNTVGLGSHDIYKYFPYLPEDLRKQVIKWYEAFMGLSVGPQEFVTGVYGNDDHIHLLSGFRPTISGYAVHIGVNSVSYIAGALVERADPFDKAPLPEEKIELLVTRLYPGDKVTLILTEEGKRAQSSRPRSLTARRTAGQTAPSQA